MPYISDFSLPGKPREISRDDFSPVVFNKKGELEIHTLVGDPDVLKSFAVNRNGRRYVARAQEVIYEGNTHRFTPCAIFESGIASHSFGPASAADAAAMMWILENELTLEQKEQYAPEIERLKKEALRLGADKYAYWPYQDETKEEPTSNL